MMRVLIDTNVLVAAAYNPGSASRKIVRAVGNELQLIVSPDILREYEAVLPKAIRAEATREWIWQSLESAESVTPEATPPVTEDRSDDKFLAAAAAGQASAVVTSDRHLLAVHPYEGIHILQPTAFWNWLRGGDD